MLDIILDSLTDSLKLLPFLFLTFLAMEYLEDRMKDKTRIALKKAGHFGPFFGGVLGAIPQCGFSAAASNLYAGHIISMGTLIAIYLSTSDEMVPILLTSNVPVIEILKIVVLKVIIGIVAGFAIDIVMQKALKKKEEEIDIHHFCEHEHCECGHGILKPAIKHTLRIFIFILIISIVLSWVISFVGLERLYELSSGHIILGPVVVGLIGLIPNCGASVAITAAYVEGVLSFGTMMAGLLINAGVGIVILFKVNENKKSNIIILGILYLIGIVSGVVMNLL